MAGLLKKALRLLTGSDEMTAQSFGLKSKPSRRELIQHESEIGGHLFGPVPAGHHRQFFNLDQSTWIWYEEWDDESGQHHTSTTRYEVHDNGILKVQEGSPYYYIEGDELDNIVAATKLYYEQVARNVYQRDPSTGRFLNALHP